MDVVDLKKAVSLCADIWVYGVDKHLLIHDCLRCAALRSNGRGELEIVLASVVVT
jgi:hypothetical protein